MDRTREDILKDLQQLQEKATHDQIMEAERDNLFMEVLLDIRDELRRIRQNQGEAKWSSKL